MGFFDNNRLLNKSLREQASFQEHEEEIDEVKTINIVPKRASRPSKSQSDMKFESYYIVQIEF